MEYVVIPSKKEDILEYKNNGINTFLIGLEDLSSGYLVTLKLEEIKQLSLDVNLFVSINKMIENKDLEKLEEALLFLDNTNIKGVLYYDLSVLSLRKKHNLNLDLVWNQTHMVTNYNTCNFYYNEGVKYAYISSEVTLEEILEIVDKSKMSFFVNIIGHPVMSHSKRKLLTNYFKANKLDCSDNFYILSEKNDTSSFIIYEDKSGTTIRYGNIMNGCKYLKELINSNVSYLVIDTSYIDSNTVSKILPILLNIKSSSNVYSENINELNTILGTDTLFFDRKTIYKVKKGDIS